MSKQPIGRFIVILGPRTIYVGYINYTVEGTDKFQTQKNKKHQKLKIKKRRNIKWKFFKINTLNSLEIV